MSTSCPGLLAGYPEINAVISFTITSVSRLASLHMGERIQVWFGHRCPYKREAEGDLTHTQRRRQCEDRQTDLKMLTLKIGVMQPQDKECQ